MDEDKKYSIGSLFSGIGGFELVASWYGIEPLWASEIEPSCVRITSKHFPDMRHYGDITKIKGDEIAPVDVLTGGFPCVGLSLAGKQAGIQYECPKCKIHVKISNIYNSICPYCGSELQFTCSGLFMEQIRIIQEMRRATNERFPKIAIAENVRGCLTSNGGDDFYTILKEFCALIGEKLPAFRPEKWAYAGEILADTGSIAWRTLDAQYWGVPQRRRRVFLVIDFGGQRASEILFKQEGMRRYPTTRDAPWKQITAQAGNRSEDATDICDERIDMQQRLQKNTYVAAFAHQTGSKLPMVPYSEELSPTLNSHQTMAVAIESSNVYNRLNELEDDPTYVVRKFTPIEVERLQGFPDNWTFGESDANRYKALGNSVALPCVDYIMRGVRDALDNTQ